MSTASEAAPDDFPPGDHDLNCESRLVDDDWTACKCAERADYWARRWDRIIGMAR